MLGLISEFMMACIGFLERDISESRVYVIKVLAEHKGNSEFHPSNGEKVITQETVLIFFSTEIHPVFIEQDKGIPFVW